MDALVIKNLRKVYKNNIVALDDISLTVKTGDFFALLGQNGAGKSTTIGILCSLVNKTAGKVTIFGYDIDSHWEEAKSCIGIVPQELNFNPFEKIHDVLLNQAGYYGIPRKIARPRAEIYLNKLGLWEKRNHIGFRLSGGMKRRLMIARALMNEPKLLVLDEPSAGVDVELRHELWEFLIALNAQGTTIILTTHYLEEAERLCKNAAIIDQGKIIANASMKSLVNRLHIQTLVLDLAQPITQLPELSDFPAKLLDATTIETELHQDQNLTNLFAQLTRQQITVTSLRNKTNRLEELFVRLIHENKAKS
jgi:ABC-2 type transport system ATP-binding protein